VNGAQPPAPLAFAPAPRLVLLPHEGHNYVARESLHRVAAEITAWLDKYVKPAAPAGSAE